MEALVNQVIRCSSKDRVDVGEKVNAFLRQPDADISAEAGSLVSALLPWLSQSNFKVCLAALNALLLLAERLGDALHVYMGELVPPLMERLGDGKEQIRNTSLEVLLALMGKVASPKAVFEHLGDAGFKHKNWHVRHMVLECFQQALSTFGPSGLGVSKCVPTICKLTADPNEHVREAAICALVEAYRHIGERLRNDVQRQSSIPSSKMPTIMERFDAVLHSGTMVAKPTLSRESSASSLDTSSRSTRPASSVRSESASSARRANASQGGARSHSADSSFHRKSAKSNSSITEEEFEAAMYDGTPISIHSESELSHEFKRMNSILCDDKIDWEKRVASLKRLRSLVLGGADEIGNFFHQLRSLTDSLIKSITDLRSGVTREACITVAQLADAGKASFEPFVEIFVPSLFKQVMINTKVMADSAHFCLRQIVRSTYSSRMMTILWEQRASKAAVQRKRAAEYLMYALECWDAQLLSRHTSLISKFLVALQNDADSVARATARRAHWRFHSKFPAEADKVMDQLNPSRQKHLWDEKAKMDAGHELGATLTTVVSRSSSSRRRSASNPQHGKPRPKSQFDSSLTVPSSMSRSKSDLDTEHTRSRSPPRSATTPRAPSSTLRNSGPARVKDTGVSSFHDSGPKRQVRSSLGPSRREEARAQSQSTSSSSSTATTASGARRVARPVTSPNLSRSGPARRVTAPKSPPSSSANVSGVSETPLRSAYGEDLVELLRQASETDWSERMKAASRLKELLRSSRRPTPREIKRVTEYFIDQFGEPHNKVFANIIDTLCDFIVVHKGNCPEGWLWDLLSALLLKMGSSDLVSKTHAKILYALELVRDSFPVHSQLSALFKLFLDTRQAQNIKVKIAMLEYLALLVPRATSGDFEDVYNSSPSEGRGATQKIIELSQEPKSADLRKMATHVVTELFELNPPLFSRILSALSILPSDIARRILSTHIENWEEMIDGGGGVGSYAPDASDVYDEDDDDGVEMDSGSNGHIVGSVPLARTGYNPSAYEDQGASSPNLASNDAALEDILDSLGDPGSADSADTQATLQWLIRSSKENDADTWDPFFSNIFGVVLTLLEDQLSNIRELALRLLRELFKNQTDCFDPDDLQTAIMRVLRCHQDSAREVLRAAEESLLVVSRVIPSESCIRILEPVLLKEDDTQMLQAALRLLTKAIQLLDDSVAERLLPVMLPGLFRGYKHTAAEIRKAVVTALVELHLVLGEKLKPHLTTLSSSQQKLLSIYIKRAEAAANA